MYLYICVCVDVCMNINSSLATSTAWCVCVCVCACVFLYKYIHSTLYSRNLPVRWRETFSCKMAALSSRPLKVAFSQKCTFLKLVFTYWGTNMSQAYTIRAFKVKKHTAFGSSIMCSLDMFTKCCSPSQSAHICPKCQ